MNTIPCRSCAAPIGFSGTPQGKKLPVDPDLIKTFFGPRAGGATARRLVLVLENGTTRSGYECSATDPDAEAVEGYVSHFATCSDPKAWRRCHWRTR